MSKHPHELRQDYVEGIDVTFNCTRCFALGDPERALWRDAYARALAVELAARDRSQPAARGAARRLAIEEADDAVAFYRRRAS